MTEPGYPTSLGVSTEAISLLGEDITELMGSVGFGEARLLAHDAPSPERGRGARPRGGARRPRRPRLHPDCHRGA